MDTEKLITVTVWATLALIGYEVLTKFSLGGTTSSATDNAINNALAAGETPNAQAARILEDPNASDQLWAQEFANGGFGGLIPE